MTRIEILERELNYQLRVYKGKTNKYFRIKKELEFYRFLYMMIFIQYKIKQGKL